MYEGGQSRGFNKNDPQYLCFCNSVHVKTLTYILCLMSAVSVGAHLGSLIMTIVRGENVVVDVVGVIIEILFLLSLYFALRREQAVLLLATIILQIIFVVVYGLSSILFFVSFFFSAEAVCKYEEEKEEKTTCRELFGKKGVYFAVSLLCFLLHLVLTVAEVRCYRYFKDKARYEVATYDTERH